MIPVGTALCKVAFKIPFIRAQHHEEREGSVDDLASLLVAGNPEFCSIEWVADQGAARQADPVCRRAALFLLIGATIGFS